MNTAFFAHRPARVLMSYVGRTEDSVHEIIDFQPGPHQYVAEYPWSDIGGTKRKITEEDGVLTVPLSHEIIRDFGSVGDRMALAIFYQLQTIPNPYHPRFKEIYEREPPQMFQCALYSDVVLTRGIPLDVKLYENSIVSYTFKVECERKMLEHTVPSKESRT